MSDFSSDPLSTSQMRRLAWAFAGRLCDKYQNLKELAHFLCFANYGQFFDEFLVLLVDIIVLKIWWPPCRSG